MGTAQKLPWVQVMRGIAAMMVLLYHASLNNEKYFGAQSILGGFFNYGWLGVEFFFVLSGFIITYVHYPDLLSRMHTAWFLKRRFYRIYPIYWIVATAALIYYLFLKRDSTGITVQLHGTNDFWYLLKCYLLIPLGSGKHNFVDLAWTLCFEVFFYLVFALWIKSGFRKTIYVYAGWIVLILAKHYTGKGDEFQVLNFMFNPLVLYFLGGCFVAFCIKRYNLILNWKQAAALVLFFLLGLFVYSYLSNSRPLETRGDINYYYLLISLFSILLWSIASLDIRRPGKRTAPFLLLLIGDASYSIYLSHVFSIMFFYKSARMMGDIQIHNGFIALSLIATAFLVSMSIGIALHLFVEKPLLKFLNGRRQPLGATLAIT